MSITRKGPIDIKKNKPTIEKPEVHKAIKKFKDVASGELTLLKDQRVVGHDVAVSTIIGSISSSSKSFRPTKTDLGVVRDKSGFDRDLCAHVLLLRQELLLLKKKGVGMSDAIEQLTQRILTSKKEPEIKPGCPGNKEKDPAAADTRKGKRRRDTDGEPRPSKKVTRIKNDGKKESQEDGGKNFGENNSGGIPGSGENLVNEILGAMGVPVPSKEEKNEKRTESDVQQNNSITKKRKRSGDLSESDVESEPALKQARLIPEDVLQEVTTLPTNEIHKPGEILSEITSPPGTPGYPASWTPGSTDSPIYGPVDSLVDSPVYSPCSPSYTYSTADVPVDVPVARYVYDGPVDGLVDGTVDCPVARYVDSLVTTTIANPVIMGPEVVPVDGPVTGVDDSVTGPVVSVTGVDDYVTGPVVPVTGVDDYVTGPVVPVTGVDDSVTGPVVPATGPVDDVTAMGPIPFPVTGPVVDPVPVPVTGPGSPIEGFIGDFIYTGPLPLPEMDEIVPFSLGEAGKRRLETADELLADVDRTKRRNMNL